MTISATAHQRTACDRDTRLENFAADSAPPESGIEASLDDYINFGK